MTTEVNKQIIERLFHIAMNNKHLAIADEVIASTFVSHGIQGKKKGPAGFKEMLQQFSTAFPDFHVYIEKIIAEDDLVATAGYWTGTHKENFLDIIPSGKEVRVQYIDFWRIKNGMCIEHWMQMEMLGILDQIDLSELAAV